MNAEAPWRGKRLVAGGSVVRTGPTWLARLFAGSGQAILDRIDRGLDTGSIDATLPDGTRRLLGGRAPGFKAVVALADWRSLLRLATGGSVGWYQAWAAREWSSPDPVPLFALFMANGASLGGTARARGPWRRLIRAAHWLRRNSRSGAKRNILAHYDLGNDFYAAWLDPAMVYSSGLFGGLHPSPETLGQAQQQKMDAIVERLRVGPGDRVLDIGCGWGALAARIEQATGASVLGISLSDQQLLWAARTHLSESPARLDFQHRDYRELTGAFDAIASVEMVEAVGERYWPDFLDCVARCLRPGGRAAIQYISIRDDLFESYARSADFIQTYVFPGGMLIRESAFRAQAAARGLDWSEQVSFRRDYALTLAVWRENFERAVAEERLPAGFDERFVALWRYYLMYCEGGFRGGGIDVAQVTLIRR